MRSKFFHHLSHILHALINAGTSPDHPSFKNKTIRTANTLCFSVMLNTFAFMIISIILGNSSIFLITLGALCIDGIAYLLMWKKKTLASRVLLAISGIFIIYGSTAYVGQESLVHVMLFSVSASALILFDWSENRLAAIFTLLPILAFGFGQATDFKLPGIPRADEGTLPIEALRIIAVFGSSLIVLGSILFFRNQIRAHQFEIESYVQRIQDEQQMQIYAHKMASLGEMASGMAHEINTPLTALLIRVRKLQKSLRSIEIDEDTRASITQDTDSIVEMAQRVTAIIRSLESIAYPGTTPPFQNVPLSEVVQNAVELCYQRFAKAKIDLTIQVPPHLEVECRAGQMSQILLSLLQNAYDAIANSEQEEWVSINARERGESIVVEVKNSGSRIPPSLQERIFEPFFTTKRPGQGTGLGLSISRALAEEHGGQLEWIPQAADTTFRLTLPKAQA